MATVLIVDDRKINRDFLCSILTYLDHQTIEAQHGIEALAAIEKRRPDLIITDILMPVMDGYEFIRQLKKIEHDTSIPIIIYTATYRKEEANLLAQDLGVKHVISKPSDPQLMINIIQSAIGVNQGPTTEFISTAKNMNDSLYAAPQHLVMIEEKCQHAMGQINYIKKLLHDGHTDFLLKEKGTFVETIDGIYKDIHRYQKTNKQLFSLLELTLELISERDERKLLQLFCHGARKAVDAEFAAAGIIDNQRNVVFLATSGNFNEDIFPPIGKKITSDFISEILKQHSSYICKQDLFNSIPWKLSFVKNALCCPIITPTQVYGFTYFVNKKEISSFNEEDIRMLDTLSSEVSIFYENIEMYDLIQQQAAKLQIESAKLKEAKDNLSKSELMFRQFAENINDVFWRINSNLNEVIYISPGYETIWGKSTDTVYQDPCSWQDEILEEDKPKIKAFIKQVLHTQEDAPIEYKIKRKDGAIRNIYNKTICLKDSKGHLSHIIGIASDITEYLQNQKGIVLEEEIGRILEKGDSFTEIAPQILRLICRIFDWEIGELWIVDANNKYIQHVCLWHKKKKSYALFDAASESLKLNLNEDLAGLIWHSAQPQWLANYASHTNSERARALNYHHLGDTLGFPLIYQENVFGVMSFIAENISPIGEDFNRILTTLGTRIGEFISQKMTHDQLLQIAKRGANRIIF